jgi:hypothetical protein
MCKCKRSETRCGGGTQISPNPASGPCLTLARACVGRWGVCRLLGVAGTTYSVERSQPTVPDPAGVASGAVGQLGFGLFCRRPGASWYSSGSEDPATEWSCGMFCGVRGGAGAGSARGVREVALAGGVLPGRWTHLAGTYSPDGGGVCGLTVDGVAAAAVAAPGGLLYSPDPALFALPVTPGVPPVEGISPDSRMGFGIGRLIMAARASSVEQVFQARSCEGGQRRDTARKTHEGPAQRLETGGKRTRVRGTVRQSRPQSPPGSP